MTEHRHSETSHAVLRSLVPVICPPEAHALADDIVAHMARTLGAAPPLVRKALAAGLAAYDLGALPLHLRRARHLAPEAAERYYASWERGPTPLHAQLARAVKQLMSLSCYEQPAMMERVGYRPGPWIDEVRHKRLTVHRDDVLRQEAQVLAPDPLRPGVRVAAREQPAAPPARATKGGA
ncbi:MAG TPA: hypothetical protein VN253_28095 [Kofleriaceae bacterium]|nr:hypothetical protein [Kofleriaceae bacterium]